jgi:hypothetical protein
MFYKKIGTISKAQIQLSPYTLEAHKVLISDLKSKYLTNLEKLLKLFAPSKEEEDLKFVEKGQKIVKYLATLNPEDLKGEKQFYDLKLLKDTMKVDIEKFSEKYNLKYQQHLKSKLVQQQQQNNSGITDHKKLLEVQKSQEIVKTEEKETGDFKVLILEKIQKMESENDLNLLKRLNVLEESFSPTDFVENSKKRKVFESKICSIPKFVQKKQKIEKIENLSYSQFIKDAENLNLIKHKKDETNFYFEFPFDSTTKLFFYFENVEPSNSIGYHFHAKEYNSETKEYKKLTFHSNLKEFIEIYQKKMVQINQIKKQIEFMKKKFNHLIVEMEYNDSLDEIKLKIQLKTYIFIPMMTIVCVKNEMKILFEDENVDQFNFAYLKAREYFDRKQFNYKNVSTIIQQWIDSVTDVLE